MAEAINERVDAIRNRARTILEEAQASRQPWLARLGVRPADVRAASAWDETALAVAAYRDAWIVTTPTPLGEPTILLQRQDVIRVQASMQSIMNRKLIAEPPLPQLGTTDLGC